MLFQIFNTQYNKQTTKQLTYKQQQNNLFQRQLRQDHLKAGNGMFTHCQYVGFNTAADDAQADGRPQFFKLSDQHISCLELIYHL
jgi:hypothetical protein